MRYALPTAALLLALLSTGGSPAEATSMIRLSTEQMVDASDAVVRGTVTDIWTEYTNDRVWTYAQVEVTEVLKGDPGQDLLVISQPGGLWAHRQTTVAGAARFSLGEDAYFFVEHVSSAAGGASLPGATGEGWENGGRTILVGMFQGKYNVQMDPYSRQEIVHRFAVGPHQEFDHRFLPLPPADQRLSTADFESRIRARVATGWDGQPIPGISSEKLRRINRLQEGAQ